jgi:PPOX class probable F420-dependent enzyme
MGTNERSKIVMTDDEVTQFIERSRTCTMITNGPSGHPHAVAMWYALVDGQIWFETKAKSQKVQNIKRDDRITVSIEDGLTYDTLRGIAVEGRAVVVDDADALWKVGVSVWERYNGPYTEEMAPFVEVMLNKRVAVRVDVDRIRTWDHRKLGMAPTEVGGSTAEFL